jgi:UDP-N-acetylmuramate--alanine ligase
MIHFVGIGGIGMSALARMFLHEGKEVSGSDLASSLVTDELEKVGAKIYLTQEAKNILPEVDLVIYTVAIPEANAELVEARSRGIECVTYPQMLGRVSKDKYTIAVSGTHGKTTTTAMIATAMLEAKLDPTVVVGSFLLGYKSNFIAGASKYFVVEACEYKRSFLNLHPNILVITNIDDDHLDYYKDSADIDSAFREMAERVPEDGFIVADLNNERVKHVLAGVKAHVINYREVEEEGIVLKGKYNRENARAALAVLSCLSLPVAAARASLNSFTGTWRRFELKGTTTTGALVFDDYAHHPTEIAATLQLAAESCPGKNLVAVFQPHLYSRTKEHLHEFAAAFAPASRVILAPIYAAREPFDPSITSEAIALKIQSNSPAVAVSSLTTFEEIAVSLSNTTANDVIVVMGAGNISDLATVLVKGK